MNPIVYSLLSGAIGAIIGTFLRSLFDYSKAG